MRRVYYHNTPSGLNHVYVARLTVDQSKRGSEFRHSDEGENLIVDE